MNGNKPRVFISYARESDAHIAKVEALDNWLRDKKIDIHSDFDHPHRPPREGWQTWMSKEIRDADVVLVICSEKYLKRFNKEEEAGIGLGVTWEGAILTQELYEASLINEKFYPILPDGGAIQHIPSVLRSFFNGCYFPSSYEKILRLILNQDIPQNPSEPKPKREDYGLEMEEEDTEGESEAESALKAAIKKLKIRRPTELDLVNCNRRTEYNTFKRIFPSIQSKVGVFFIAGCHSQSPEALAERFFYESRKHKWKGREDSIHYVRENNNHSRVKIEKLSSIEEWDITGAQTSMRTYWEERFGPLTESKTYDEYVHEYLAKLQYSCIVSAFEIDAKTWDSCDYIHDFINWLSDPLTQIQGESPFFLFFIVVKARNAHIRNQMDDNTINALDDIKHFTEKSLKNPVNILGDFISGLDYVEIDDVKDWFDKLDETNPERIEKCVELLGGQISAQDEQDIFWDKKKVNMWRILELQHKIYQIHNR